jgi:hypothetical protein
MAPEGNDDCEKVFSKLPDHGYSEKITAKIWRWYHPECEETKSSES